MHTILCTYKTDIQVILPPPWQRRLCFGSIRLTVCLQQHYTKRYKRITNKFYGGGPG